MTMYCNQCQETAKNEACTIRGVCGKTEDTAALQDVLIHMLKGVAIFAAKAPEGGPDLEVGEFVTQGLFSTITNANFDNDRFALLIKQAHDLREQLRERHGTGAADEQHDAATFSPSTGDELVGQGALVGIMATEDEDLRSLRQLLIFGLKGIAAYAEHASVLGHQEPGVFNFMIEGLAATTKDLTVDEMVALVLRAGEVAVQTMALLDTANTTTYGTPEISTVSIGVGSRPGILVSGHDLRDLFDLLEQTAGSGVDVYTHSEMLPAHYYPAFKKYDHLVGNYGNAWWQQNKEFSKFNGPIVMTTNCITPVKDAYRDRIFTTGVVGYSGVRHIADREDGKSKDFSEVIELAKTCPPPTEIETGEIVGGFGHGQVLALADKVVDAVKAGAIKRFVVMAGCDGRQKQRSYFTDVAEGLPADAVILTAGCAKYRYNKLDLGDIGGIPRVLDAGQCNDCYSLAVIALKLKEVFGLEDINQLPISFDIGWYEQKAVAVLLALLHLGVKNIRLGPTLPAFLSPNVANVLVENFDIKPIGEVAGDIEAMMAGG